MNNRTKTSALRVAVLAALLGVSSEVLAQPSGNGASALSQTATTIRSYGVAAQTIILALGVIIGLIGAIRVYSKFHNGDPDTQKAVMSWFGASLFLVAVGTILQAFFG